VVIKKFAYPAEFRKICTRLYKPLRVNCPAELQFKGRCAPLQWRDNLVKYFAPRGGVPTHLFKALEADRGCPINCSLDLGYQNTLWKEGVLEYLSRTNDVLTQQRVMYFRFMGTVWRALILAFANCGFKPTLAWRAEALRRCLADPEGLAAEIKTSAGEARAEAFLGTPHLSGMFQCLSVLKDFQKLQYSMVARALPAPLYQDDDVIDPYLERMTSEPAVLDDFPAWVADWFFRHRPKRIHHGGFTIGASSCVELSRLDGGKAATISTLVEIGRQFREKGPKGLSLFEAPAVYGMALKVQSGWQDMILGSLLVCEQLHAKGITPGAYIIVAPEKGLKTRLPTAGIAPVLVLQHLLRMYVDQFLVNDARIGPSITPGDAFRNPIGEPGPDLFLRSLDATTATDLHPFSLQRGIYSALFEYLPDLEFFHRLKALVPLLCGPRVLLEDRPCGYPRQAYKLTCGNPVPSSPGRQSFRDYLEKTAKGYCEYNSGKISREYSSRGLSCVECNFKAPKGAYELCQNHFNQAGHSRDLSSHDAFTRIPFSSGQGIGLESTLELPLGSERAPWPSNLIDLVVNYHQTYQRDGPKSTVGAMMGEPTSWPGLSILNVWCWEGSVPFHRWSELRTTGDDAFGFVTLEESSRLTQLIEKRGGKISTTKDFLSKEFGLFTEVITDSRGEPLGVNPISTLVGPFGGSKGTVNWAACPSHTEAVVKRVNGLPFPKRIWKRSRFYNDWRTAANTGLPLGMPSFTGGISLPPLGLHPFKGKVLRKWGFLLGNISRREFVERGLNLCLSRQPRFGAGLAEIARANLEVWIGTQPLMLRITLRKNLDKLSEALFAGYFTPAPEGKLNLIGDGVSAEKLILEFRSHDALLRLMRGELPRMGENAPAVFKAAERFSSRVHRLPSTIKVRRVGSLIQRVRTLGEFHISGITPDNPLVLFPSTNVLRQEAEPDDGTEQFLAYPPLRDYPDMRYRR